MSQEHWQILSRYLHKKDRPIFPSRINGEMIDTANRLPFDIQLPFIARGLKWKIENGAIEQHKVYKSFINGFGLKDVANKVHLVAREVGKEHLKQNYTISNPSNGQIRNVARLISEEISITPFGGRRLIQAHSAVCYVNRFDGENKLPDEVESKEFSFDPQDVDESITTIWSFPYSIGRYGNLFTTVDVHRILPKRNQAEKYHIQLYPSPNHNGLDQVVFSGDVVDTTTVDLPVERDLLPVEPSFRYVFNHKGELISSSSH